MHVINNNSEQYNHQIGHAVVKRFEGKRRRAKSELDIWKKADFMYVIRFRTVEEFLCSDKSFLVNNASTNHLHFSVKFILRRI